MADITTARTRASAAVCDLDRPAEPGFVYVAGEARTVQAVCAHLVREGGRPRRSVLVRPGIDARRARDGGALERSTRVGVTGGYFLKCTCISSCTCTPSLAG
ncbi:SIP domain-containing protein [Actinomadura geliboluensis]|uniref:SIP domain-containing protein n=1 Tax=Actinomadura geliboluensis TaxID=882440 RepID=UPI00371556DE